MEGWQANRNRSDSSGGQLTNRTDAQSANDLPEVVSWSNPDEVRIAGAESLLPAVEIYATGWQTALRRDPVVKSLSLDWKVALPQVVSVPVKTPQVKVLGFACEV